MSRRLSGAPLTDQRHAQPRDAIIPSKPRAVPNGPSKKASYPRGTGTRKRARPLPVNTLAGGRCHTFQRTPNHGNPRGRHFAFY